MRRAVTDAQEWRAYRDRALKHIAHAAHCGHHACEVELMRGLWGECLVESLGDLGYKITRMPMPGDDSSYTTVRW